MQQLQSTIDAVLNRYTMYRIIIYSLAAYLVVAFVLSFGHQVSVTPQGLVLSVALLCAVCYGTNLALSWLLRIPHNTESWLVSALILACIVPPASSPDHWLGLGLAGAIAMASKYLITFRGSHFLNPAAFGAFVVSAFGLLPVDWWVATPAMTASSIILALVVLRKQRRFQLFFTFALSAIAMQLVISSMIGGQPPAEALRTLLLAVPLLFFGSIMLPEPSTLPPTNRDQLLFAVLVGCLFASQIVVGPIALTPQVALLLGNLFTLLLAPASGTMLRLKELKRLTPTTFGLSFVPKRQLVFAPGQYLEWTLPHVHPDARGNRRLFSIASSPTEKTILLGTKQYDPSSTFKATLLTLEPEAEIRVAHVAGSFTLPMDPNEPLLFVAGGIGITPYRSMLKYLIDTKQQRDIVLVYSAASEQEFVFKDVLKEAEKTGLRTHFVTGRLDATTLQQLVPDIATRITYLSGPDAMVTGYRHMARGLGVPGRHIRTDHFTGY